MISPACKTCPSYSIYCEYDPLTDTLYPNNPDCPITRQKDGENHEQTSAER